MAPTMHPTHTHAPDAFAACGACYMLAVKTDRAPFVRACGSARADLAPVQPAALVRPSEASIAHAIVRHAVDATKRARSLSHDSEGRPVAPVAARVVLGAFDSVQRSIGAPATAARSTRDLSARIEAGESVDAIRALDRDVTGALPRARMRVRGPGKRTGHTANVCRDATPRPLPSADTMTGAREALHGKACADLARAFQARNDSTGAARKAATSQIRAIVAIWTGDHDIAAICRANEWTVNIG